MPDNTIENLNTEIFIREKNIGNSSFIFSLLILLFVAYFQLFYNLDKLPLRVWDEGKNAVSAYEMFTNGDYLVRHYEGQPDTWGFKPPFLTWNQVAAMKVFGMSEFAIRFPSALYAFLTAILIFYFLNSEFRKPFVGLLASIVLLTSYGYLDRHIARTGDHDSMLVFFLTSQLVFFYKYLKTSNNIYLILFITALIFASFTKGIAGLFFIPGIAVYVILSAQLKNVLFDKRIYFSILAFLLFTGGYYALREISAPGYLKAVWENELLPRYTNTASNYKYEHTTDYLFYLRNLWDKRLTPWIYLLPFMMILLSFSKDKKLKSVFWFIVTIGISFLAIISGGSKGTWYDAPIYPIIATVLALGFFQLFIFLKRQLHYRMIATVVTILIVIPFLYQSVENTRTLTLEIEEKTWNHQVQGISYFLRDQQEEVAKLKDLGIAYKGYHSHIRFYSNVANENGANTYFVNYKELKIPSTVIASQNEVKEYIQDNYIFTRERTDFGTSIFKIEARKQS